MKVSSNIQKHYIFFFVIFMKSWTGIKFLLYIRLDSILNESHKLYVHQHLCCMCMTKKAQALKMHSLFNLINMEYFFYINSFRILRFWLASVDETWTAYYRSIDECIRHYNQKKHQQFINRLFFIHSLYRIFYKSVNFSDLIVDFYL